MCFSVWINDCGSVQMYTGTGADGTTEKNFKVHLQLWDTAGQERWVCSLGYCSEVNTSSQTVWMCACYCLGLVGQPPVIVSFVWYEANFYHMQKACLPFPWLPWQHGLQVFFSWCRQAGTCYSHSVDMSSTAWLQHLPPKGLCDIVWLVNRILVTADASTSEFSGNILKKIV